MQGHEIILRKSGVHVPRRLIVDSYQNHANFPQVPKRAKTARRVDEPTGKAIFAPNRKVCGPIQHSSARRLHSSLLKFSHLAREYKLSFVQMLSTQEYYIVAGKSTMTVQLLPLALLLCSWSLPTTGQQRQVILILVRLLTAETFYCSTCIYTGSTVQNYQFHVQHSYAQSYDCGFLDWSTCYRYL